jgi:hypothetical protein
MQVVMVAHTERHHATVGLDWLHRLLLALSVRS